MLHVLILCDVPPKHTKQQLDDMGWEGSTRQRTPRRCFEPLLPCQTNALQMEHGSPRLVAAVLYVPQTIYLRLAKKKPFTTLGIHHLGSRGRGRLAHPTGGLPGCLQAGETWGPRRSSWPRLRLPRSSLGRGLAGRCPNVQGSTWTLRQALVGSLWKRSS